MFGKNFRVRIHVLPRQSGLVQDIKYLSAKDRLAIAHQDIGGDAYFE
jgi:hypothetical protein